MNGNERNSEPTTPTGQFEFKLRGLLSEQVYRDDQRRSLKRLLDLVEKNIIMDALQRADGSQKTAGRLLGLKYTTFCAKLKRYGIRVIRHFGVRA
jgi:DNA-binding NtrC family response regulator